MNYAKEMNKLSDKLWEDLCKTIDKCMERNVFIKEEYATGKFWYLMPEPIDVPIPHSNDYGLIQGFCPEGTEYPGNFKAPRGGMIYTDHDFAEEIKTVDLWDDGKIELLEGLNRILGEPINSDYHTLIV